MFLRLWEAINGLIASINRLRGTADEIDVNVRERVGLPPRGEDGEPIRQLGGRKAKTP